MGNTQYIVVPHENGYTSYSKGLTQFEQKLLQNSKKTPTIFRSAANLVDDLYPAFQHGV